MGDYLGRRISYFWNTHNTSPVDHITIGEALEQIRVGKYAAAVERVRAVGDKSERNEVKRAVAPAYTWRGRFTKRAIAGLVEPSGIIDIDLDDVAVQTLKDSLTGHENVLAFHDSISGHQSNGLRVLVPVDPAPQNNQECHQAFDAVCRTFGLEEVADALKDISRLSYTSFDAGLYVNADALPVRVHYKAKEEKSTPTPALDHLTEGQKYLQLRHLGGLLRWGGASSEMINTALQALREHHSDDPGEAEPVEKLSEWLGEQDTGLNLTSFLAEIARTGAHDKDDFLLPKTSPDTFAGNGHLEHTGIAPKHYENGIPDSRSLRKEKSGMGRLEVCPMFGFSKPPPRLWVVDQFIPAGYVTLLAADGGTGKSYLAVMLSVCVALGIDFLGLPVVRGRVLYLDFELDREEMERRYWSILAGLEITPDYPEIEDQLYYVRPRAPLHRLEEEIRRVIAEIEPVLIIVDSLTIASMVDANSQADITPVMQLLETFGTVLCLDHLSRAGTRNVSQSTAFGSIFKRNHARSTWNLAKADGGGLMLVPDKNNFAPPGELVTYNMTFAEDTVRFSNVSLVDDSFIGALSHMPAKDITFKAVMELTAGPRKTCTFPDVGQWRTDNEVPVSEKTIRNHVTMLQREDKVSLMDGEISPTLRYVLAHARKETEQIAPIPDDSSYIGAGNRESPF